MMMIIEDDYDDDGDVYNDSAGDDAWYDVWMLEAYKLQSKSQHK
jgi:hypothetical protein